MASGGVSPSKRACPERKLLVVRSPGPIDSILEDALGADFEIESWIVDTPHVLGSFGPAAFEVVLLDLRRANGGALPLLAAVRQAVPDAAAVVVAADLPDNVVLEALRLDVSGLVVEPTDGPSIAECVRRVREGHLCLDQRTLRRAVKTLAERQIAARELAKLLTAREVEIVQLAGRGLANKEIAAELFVAEGTIKVHLHNIFEKLGIRNRGTLAAYAREKGLV